MSRVVEMCWKFLSGNVFGIYYNASVTSWLNVSPMESVYYIPAVMTRAKKLLTLDYKSVNLLKLLTKILRRVKSI